MTRCVSDPSAKKLKPLELLACDATKPLPVFLLKDIEPLTTEKSTMLLLSLNMWTLISRRFWVWILHGAYRGLQDQMQRVNSCSCAAKKGSTTKACQLHLGSVGRCYFEQGGPSEHLEHHFWRKSFSFQHAYVELVCTCVCVCACVCRFFCIPRNLSNPKASKQAGKGTEIKRVHLGRSSRTGGSTGLSWQTTLHRLHTLTISHHSQLGPSWYQWGTWRVICGSLSIVAWLCKKLYPSTFPVCYNMPQKHARTHRQQVSCTDSASVSCCNKGLIENPAFSSQTKEQMTLKAHKKHALQMCFGEPSLFLQYVRDIFAAIVAAAHFFSEQKWAELRLSTSFYPEFERSTLSVFRSHSSGALVACLVPSLMRRFWLYSWSHVSSW